MGARRITVPGQVRLRVDRALGLRGDVVETADVGRGDDGRGSEPGGAEAVRILRNVDGGGPFAAGRVLVDHLDLSVGPDRDVAVVALRPT